MNVPPEILKKIASVTGEASWIDIPMPTPIGASNEKIKRIKKFWIG